MSNRTRHNHMTRDIKDPGTCPACDEYWERRKQTYVANVRPPDPDRQSRGVTWGDPAAEPLEDLLDAAWEMTPPHLRPPQPES